MPWMEIQLNPQTEWNQQALEDWACALGAFSAARGKQAEPSIRVLPGYQILEIEGINGWGEIILSPSERVILVEGLAVENKLERDLASFLVRFASEMGALSLCVPVEGYAEERFWQSLGGRRRPEPSCLEGQIKREKIGIKKLAEVSLLVTYDNEPALCLEPIICNAHASGPVSLAQRRLERKFGGQPLGFASRVAIHCPWDISKQQWDDLLAYSRLSAFELLARIMD